MGFSRRAVSLGLAASLAAPAVWAQGARRTVTVVVPFPPGGSVDALARLMQEGLQERLNATIIIENKAGANGSIGAAQVARAVPDGNTLMVTFDSHSTIPALIEKPPLNVETDMVPVMLVGKAPYIVATSVKKPYRNFKDVVEAAKKAPVSYGTSGPGSSGHLAMVMLGRKANIPLDHVPYKGAGPAINDAIGGHVDLICASVAALLPQITAGNLRPIMQMGPQRLKSLADAPTTAESGFPDFLAEAWWGFFAPKGTPEPIVKDTYDALRDVLSKPAVADRLQTTQQMTLLMQGPQEFSKFFAREVVEWGKVVRENNIKGE
jgi:tripartite-type tricarboxylate transporter receptor subunit TctC